MKTNKTELFILEHTIKNGYVIINSTINFDEDGKIKNNYEISGLLKNGKIKGFKNYNFEEINFIFSIKNENIDFQKINFRTNELNFFSDSLKVLKNEKNFHFKGVIENKNSTLSKKLLDLIRLNYKNIDIQDINFDSKNNFSFKINDRFKIQELFINSQIKIDQSKYKKPNLLNDYLPEVEDIIYFKDHLIKATYKNDVISVKGRGEIKFQKKFDKIEYSIDNKNKNLNLISNINLSEVTTNNLKILKNFFPKINKKINFKDHKVQIKYIDNTLFFKGSGKIQLEKEFNQIDYSVIKNIDKFNFDTKIYLNETLLKVDYLNFITDKKFKTQLTVEGEYDDGSGLNLKKVIINSKNNKILLKNFLINKENKILKIDELSLNYIDIQNKNNKWSLLRKQKNNYELNGSIFNANSLLTNLLETKNESQSMIFKDNINLTLDLKKVYIDDLNLVENFKGNFQIEDNEVNDGIISASFNDNKKLILTISTKNGEKITTFSSSRAKPFVKRYKFIKGFENGNLDFVSTKKNGISNSVLKIDNFKVQEIPILAKLLTLASLQGIADLLTGEGIRFTDFEMKFSSEKDLMTIDELYAIGPSISILMDGYIQTNKLISLRGTLVPASTINRTIASIPLVGNLLIGKKVGEGVFGVSFKIKGPPKHLKTTVNPVKTLTPRFITRTLEKIKKN